MKGLRTDSWDSLQWFRNRVGEVRGVGADPIRGAVSREPWEAGANDAQNQE